MTAKEQYQEYLKSNHWKQLRSQKLHKSNHRCCFCGRKKHLEVHHLIYRDWYSVSLEDLRVVCSRCHELSHKLESARKVQFASCEEPQSRFITLYRAIRKCIPVFKPTPKPIPHDRDAPKPGTPSSLAASARKCHKHCKKKKQHKWRNPKLQGKVLTGYWRKMPNGKWKQISTDPDWTPQTSHPSTTITWQSGALGSSTDIISAPSTRPSNNKVLSNVVNQIGGGQLEPAALVTGKAVPQFGSADGLDNVGG